jgi:hypothetical protein
MERGLIAPLSPHEEVALRRIALGISKASRLLPRDVAHLIRLCLDADNEGRLSLTDGRERYRALPKAAGMTAVAGEAEAAAVVANYVLGGRWRVLRLHPDSSLCRVTVSRRRRSVTVIASFTGAAFSPLAPATARSGLELVGNVF